LQIRLNVQRKRFDRQNVDPVVFNAARASILDRATGLGVCILSIVLTFEESSAISGGTSYATQDID